jgi:hypothetical protein
MLVDEDQKATAFGNLYEYYFTRRKHHLPAAPASRAVEWRTADDDEEEGAFVVRERWEGVVEEICDTYFVARLHNMISEEVATAELEVEDVSPVDLPLLGLGALFYWYIGYQQKRNGRRTKMSYIHFRRTRMVDFRAEPSVGWLDDDVEGD